jgi:hypothetical protein
MKTGVGRPMVAASGIWLVLSCANTLIRAPYSEDAALMRARNQEWRRRGDYCREVFEKRGQHWTLPPLVAELEDKCSRWDGPACGNLAQAKWGGYGDLDVDEPAAFALAKRACSLEVVEACRHYVNWCTVWNARACPADFLGEAKERSGLRTPKALTPS